MGKKTKLLLITTSLLASALILQSTLLRYVAVRGVKPDLALIILVFISLRTGSMIGQLSGFTAGLIQDFLSFPPLGFHSLIRTVIGFVYGLFQGALYIDALFMPILFVFSATLLKGLLSWFLGVVLSLQRTGFILVGGRFWIEVLYNSLLSPFLFALLSLIKAYKIQKEETHI